MSEELERASRGAVKIVIETLRYISGEELLLEAGRIAIENTLIEYRDQCISLPTRNNGLVIRTKDDKSSPVIRLGPEEALCIGLRAIAKKLEEEE